MESLQQSGHARSTKKRKVMNMEEFNMDQFRDLTVSNQESQKESSDDSDNDSNDSWNNGQGTEVEHKFFSLDKTFKI